MATVSNVCEDRDCLLHRLGEWQWLHQVIDAVLGAYGNTKRSYTTLNKVLNKAESVGTYGYEMVVPYYEQYAFDKVAAASKFACSKLDVLERNVPALKMSSEQLRAVPMSYYEGSMAQRTVNGVCAVPSYVQDKYQVANKAVHSAIENTKQSYNTITDTVNHRLADVKQQVQSLNEYRVKTTNNMTRKMSTVKEHAINYSNQPSLLVLNWLQLCAASMAFMTTQTMQFVSNNNERVPWVCAAPVRVTNQVALQVNTNVKQAHSLSELTDQMMNGARTQLHNAQDMVTNALPIKWMKANTNNSTNKSTSLDDTLNESTEL